jgi:ferritin
MNKSFFRTYPMFQYVDDVFYGYNFKNDGKKVNVFKDISNYVNIVDITITHRAKDNIFLQADQIKEDIEKIEEQKKRITQKILDTKSTITHN